jgi:hypothetical protein
MKTIFIQFGNKSLIGSPEGSCTHIERFRRAVPNLFEPLDHNGFDKPRKLPLAVARLIGAMYWNCTNLCGFADRRLTTRPTQLKVFLKSHNSGISNIV